MHFICSTKFPIAKCRGFLESRDIEGRFSSNSKADSAIRGGGGDGSGGEEDGERQEANEKMKSGAKGHPVLKWEGGV